MVKLCIMQFIGLSSQQVAEQPKKFCENIIPTKEENSGFLIFFSQFKSPLIYILFIISGFSFIFKNYIEGILVIAVVGLNILMGFFQEYNAKKTLIALRKILDPKTIAIRNGERKEILVKDLVVNDLVVLGAGDKIPADGKMIEGVNLLVNEAI